MIIFLNFLGIALLMGDGVITPAISILSAVEGISLIPGLPHLTEFHIVIISIFIATLLFSFQSKGTEKVSVPLDLLCVSGF